MIKKVLFERELYYYQSQAFKSVSIHICQHNLRTKDDHSETEELFLVPSCKWYMPIH